MKKTRFVLFMALLAAALFIGVTLSSCDEIFSPADKIYSAEAMARLEPSFSRILLVRGENTVTSCCNSPIAGQNDPNVILDTTSSFWGTNYEASFPSEDFYGPHWVNIDLGMEYDNVSKIEYVPYWTWGNPGGYNESWVGGTNRNNNNGIVTQFEIYLTDKPVIKGETPPADRLVGYGNWYMLENGANSVVNSGTMKFTATFNSAKGRYLQFRMLNGYRNDWRSNLSTIAQISQLHVYRTNRPYKVDTAGLGEVLRKANVLRSHFLPNYGYTNAILANWGDRAESYINNPKGITQESVDYVLTNIDYLIKLAGKRIGNNTYNRFAQKILWADDMGNNLQAHGGGTMWDPVTEKWWFYGEDRTTNITGGGQPGIHAYSSTDMYNWKDEGIAFPTFNNTVYDEPNWRSTSSMDAAGFPGGWDGNRYNPSGLHPPATETNQKVDGFIWAVNYWRKTLGDWDADGYITPGGEYYPNGRLSNYASPNTATYVTDPVTNLRGPMSIEEQNRAWDAIKNYIPADNEPLYVWQDTRAKPYATSMGLSESKVREFNALYRDIPVWRRKQMYRFWNHTTTSERPKVIYNGGQGQYKMGTATHALSGNPIQPYMDATGTYPYVMYTHIEGGAVGIGYGTCKVAVAVAKHPAGPFKFLWAYKTHFAEDVYRDGEGDNTGMTRDQSLMVDDNGTAYHFGSTVQNLIMSISMLDETYTRFVDVPRFSAGSSADQFHEEGYNNRMGANFNYVFGNQREAPAPLLHYYTENMTYEGVVAANGTITGPPVNSAKYYYIVSSTSTGWFPNPQGVYRTSQPGGPILGSNPHAKPTPADAQGTVTGWGGTDAGSAPGTGSANGSGWTTVTGNGWQTNGDANTFLFGTADDGSSVTKGYDGQTTYVQQLRYPKYVWGIIGFLDDNYVAPDVETFNTPQAYLVELRRLHGLDSDGNRPSNQSTIPIVYRKPIYGETDIPEPRAGRLVWGKYIHMSDSWDSGKNYDARYIWLPMKVIQTNVGNANPNNTARGAKARWMKEWRWEDFVYELGPFTGSMGAAPSNIVDSVGTSPSMWTDNRLPQDIRNLSDYYDMLNKAHGSSADWFQNPGKQNPGQYQEWLDWIKN